MRPRRNDSLLKLNHSAHLNPNNGLSNSMRHRALDERIVCVVLVVFSALMGLCVPSFYEWTDSNQSRPSALLWQGPLAVAVVGLLFCLALPWIPFRNRPKHKTKTSTLQFSLRSILVATFVTAIAVAAVRISPQILAWVYFAITVFIVARMAILNPYLRLATLSVWGSLSLPFIWILSTEQTGRFIPNLWWTITGLPGLLPMLMIGPLFEIRHDDGNWLAVTLTATAILMGIWMARLGPKRTIVFLVVAIAASTFGSIVLNAMVRA